MQAVDGGNVHACQPLKPHTQMTRLRVSGCLQADLRVLGSLACENACSSDSVNARSRPAADGHRPGRLRQRRGAQCLGHTYCGDFHLRGADLRARGLNRIGNMLVRSLALES